MIGVPLRSNSILQSRIRDVQYHDLERRRRSSLLRGLMFIHLKEDLASDSIDWVDRPDPGKKKESKFLTDYGVARDVRQYLAATRTDLDSFTEIEAYSLMTSAYLMTEDAFKNKKRISGFSDDGKKVDWKFLKIENSLKTQGESHRYITKLLSVAGSIAFKIWKQVAYLKYTMRSLGILLAALIIRLFIR